MISTSVLIDLDMLVKLTLVGRTTPDAAKMAGATEAALKLKVSRRQERMAFDWRREFSVKMNGDVAMSQFLLVNVEDQLSGKHSRGRNNVLNQRETNRLCGRRGLMKDLFFTQSRPQLLRVSDKGSRPGAFQAPSRPLEHG